MSEKTAKTIQAVAIIITVLALLLIVYLVVFRSSGQDGCGMNFSFSLSGDPEPYQENGQYEVSEVIAEIEVNWVHGRVKVSVDDGDTIRFEEKATFQIPESRALRYSVEKGKLHIVDYGRRGFFIGTMGKKDLTVTVPRSMAENMTLISVSSVSGGLDIADFKATDEIVLETVSGSLQASNLTADEIKLESVSGEVELIESKAKSVVTKSVSGSVNITVEEAEKIKVSSVSGSVKINPVGVERADLTYDKGSGSLTLHGITEDKDADLKIDVKIVSGSLTIGEP